MDLCMTNEVFHEVILYIFPVTIVGHQSLNELEVYKLTGPVPFVVTRKRSIIKV